jgi:hypothetical protein
MSDGVWLQKRIAIARNHIEALNILLRAKSFVDAALRAIQASQAIGFDFNSGSERFAGIPDRPGIYVFYIKFKFGNGNDDWKNEFRADWEAGGTKGFQHSPAVCKKRLRNATLSEWTPLYLGKSEHLQRRIADHLILQANKRTFALKLRARKSKMQAHQFHVKYISFPAFNGVQILLRSLEEELRERINPITGRQ